MVHCQLSPVSNHPPPQFSGALWTYPPYYIENLTSPAAPPHPVCNTLIALGLIAVGCVAVLQASLSRSAVQAHAVQHTSTSSGPTSARPLRATLAPPTAAAAGLQRTQTRGPNTAPRAQSAVSSGSGNAMPNADDGPPVPCMDHTEGGRTDSFIICGGANQQEAVAIEHVTNPLSWMSTMA